jgi:glyoxylase-like metal-dependent hydrolase (beta-lactamase superfamily II)
LSDGHEDTPADRSPLDYPFAERPVPGESLPVAPGVHWIRMPLPYALDHINLWALEDRDGWTVVDTGTRTEAVTEAWRTLFTKSPDGRSIVRIVVTHMHPDHVGMAGWLSRKFGAPLWMTGTEYLHCRVMVGDTGREAPPEAIEFYRRAGWSEEAIETYRTRFGNFGRHIHPLPDRFRRLTDGQLLDIGGHDWRIVVGHGHSPEHACLYSAGQKLLISGDQVLPRISSNVSVYPLEPEANPMQGWLDSLDKLQREVPDDVLVLPSHNEPFRGLHRRLEALRRGQHTALLRLRRSLAQPKRAIDVFGALFGRPIPHDNVPLLGMATGESLACLNWLMARGEATRELRDDGVHWYLAAGRPG